MDKLRYFTVFNVIAFGSIQTLEHSISPLISATDGLESLKQQIFTKINEKPINASPDILRSLDFDAYEKARLGYHSVGVSLIICFSELIKKIADDRAATNNHFGLPVQKSYDFYKFGPKFGEIYWAEGVVCASNYVRHDDEWQRLVTPISKKEDGINFNLSYEGIDWNSELTNFPADAKRNATTIASLGVPHEIFLKNHSKAGFEIAHALSLFNKTEALALFDEWVTEVVTDLQRALEINPQ